MLFYEATTGQVDTGQLDNSGNYHPLTSLPSGAFHVGWTHIVSIGNSTLLFYEATTGQVDTGLMQSRE